MAKLVFYDLEGPLSPMDHAYETAHRFIPKGSELFRTMSTAIAQMVEEGTTLYKSGDTLAVLVPFLLYYGVTDEDLTEVSKSAGIVQGVKETIHRLQNLEAETHIISTGYEANAKRVGDGPLIISTSFAPHTYTVGDAIGIPVDRIHCTPLRLNDLSLSERDKKLIAQAKEEIVQRADSPTDLCNYLNTFVFEYLAESDYGNPLERVKVMGGKRKADKLQEIADASRTSLSRVVAIGDSITDRDMLQAVKEHGGLAIAFNANMYALEHANVAVATTNMEDVIPLLEVFWMPEGGLEGVKKFIQERESQTYLPRKEGAPRKELQKRAHYHWLEGSNVAEIFPIHLKTREQVRGDVAKLA